MRQSTGNLVLDFIVLCQDRKAFTKIHEYEAFTDHCLDKAAIQQSVNINCRFRSKSSCPEGFAAMSSELAASK